MDSAFLLDSLSAATQVAGPPFDCPFVILVQCGDKVDGGGCSGVAGEEQFGKECVSGILEVAGVAGFFSLDGHGKLGRAVEAREIDRQSGKFLNALRFRPGVRKWFSFRPARPGIRRIDAIHYSHFPLFPCVLDFRSARAP